MMACMAYLRKVALALHYSRASQVQLICGTATIFVQACSLSRARLPHRGVQRILSWKRHPASIGCSIGTPSRVWLWSTKVARQDVLTRIHYLGNMAGDTFDLVDCNVYVADIKDAAAVRQAFGLHELTD